MLNYNWMKKDENNLSVHNTQYKIYFFRPLKNNEKNLSDNILSGKIEERYKFSEPLRD